MTLTAVTWNLRWSGGKRAVASEVELLENTHWDVAFLQEVNPRAWASLKDSGLANGGYSAFDFEANQPDGKRPHGVAILVRGLLQLTDPVPVSGLPRPGRGLGATLLGWGSPISVCSWHAPNAAASGPAVKMQGYLGFLGWIVRQRTTTTCGFDSNHWEASLDLELTVARHPPVWLVPRAALLRR